MSLERTKSQSDRKNGNNLFLSFVSSILRPEFRPDQTDCDRNVAIYNYYRIKFVYLSFHSNKLIVCCHCGTRQTLKSGKRCSFFGRLWMKHILFPKCRRIWREWKWKKLKKDYRQLYIVIWNNLFRRYLFPFILSRPPDLTWALWCSCLFWAKCSDNDE